MSKNQRVSAGSGKAGWGNDHRRREVFGVIGLGAALFLLIAMVSLQAGAMVMGPFGRSMAGLFYGLAGVCGYALIVLGAVAAVRMLLDREPALPVMIALGSVLGVIAL